MAVGINRSTVPMPSSISSEIWQKTQEDSAVMSLARKIELPGLGVTIPIITGDPEAAWIAETEKSPVKRGTFTTKLMTSYILSVTVPFSNQFLRDEAALCKALIDRLPRALAKKFDATVFGAVAAPGENFDTLKSCVEQDISTNAYKGLVAADTDIATHDGILNAWVLSPQGKAILLNAVDTNKRPLFLNNVAEGAVPMILGSRTMQSKGAYIPDTTSSNKEVIGFAGDWTQAVYGVVEGIRAAYADQATLDDGDSKINLFQQDMFAVRADMEVGFRCDPTVFNKLTKATT